MSDDTTGRIDIELRRVLRERRRFERGCSDWEYRTTTARKLYWMLRGIPACEWPE